LEKVDSMVERILGSGARGKIKLSECDLGRLDSSDTVKCFEVYDPHVNR